MAVTTLTGENDFARSQALRMLVRDFVQAEGELALERIDAGETDFLRIQEALTSLPFLANKKMVVISEPSKNKQFAEQAEKLLQALPETTELILHEPKFDKRSSLYKFLKKTTDFRDFAAMDEPALAKWAVVAAKERGATLSSSSARYLVERIGSNQLLLASEIEKLSVLGGEIDRARIDQLTEATPQSTIFQLIDAALRGDRKQALKLYDEQRALKVEPQQIIGMFAWQLHAMALIKAAGDRPTDQVAREAKLNPYVVGKTATLTRGMSLVTVRQKIDDLLTIDLRSKRESLDLDAALQAFILEFST
jgi:DNA polymerase-3 subunit delta